MKEAAISNFTMPCYSEIPGVGLYLKQVVRLINEALEPAFGITVTETMLSNYVKKHLIPNPVKKQYDRDQIALLIFITLAKTVISLENIQHLLKLQEETCSVQAAYEFFYEEFKKALSIVFQGQGTLSFDSEKDSAKAMLLNVIITIVHKLYLDRCFEEMKAD